MKENFSNLAKEMDIQFQEAQSVPNKLDPKRNTPTHIIIKMTKLTDKERILKAARGKERVTYKGMPIRLSADFSRETSQARRDWKKVFEVVPEIPKPLPIFLNSCFFILFQLDVYFFLLFQIIDLSPSFLPITVGSLNILLYFTLGSLCFICSFIF